jgi:energy-coupling factor transporter ATP-binding protein EcfA2
VVVATHDREMVDKMRRRVIELRDGRVIRDEVAGMYSVDESTTEFAARLRAELGIGTDPARRPLGKAAAPRARLGGEPADRGAATPAR